MLAYLYIKYILLIGPQGQWLFHTSFDNDQYCQSDRDDYKCRMWSNQQYKEHGTFFRSYKNSAPSCPCFLWQAYNVMFNPVFRQTKNTFCFSMAPQRNVYYLYIVEKVILNIRWKSIQMELFNTNVHSFLTVMLLLGNIRPTHHRTLMGYWVDLLIAYLQ